MMQAKQKTFEVEHIVARRIQQGSEQFLVYWKGFDLSAATWEPIDNLLACADLIDQFVRQIDPIPGSNPISSSRTNGRPKTVHVKMLKTRKSKYKRRHSAAQDDLYLDTNSYSLSTNSQQEKENLNSSFPASLSTTGTLKTKKLKLSESEILIRDTLLHESKTMSPEQTDLADINALLQCGDDIPTLHNGSSPMQLDSSTPTKRLRKPTANASYSDRSYQQNGSLNESFKIYSQTMNGRSTSHRSKSADGSNVQRLVLVETDKSFMKVTLNNLERHNTLTVEMLEALRDCFVRAANSPSTKALLLQNEGPHFCSGLDYSELLACADEREARALAEEIAGAARNLTQSILDFSKPFVVAINGPIREFGVALVALSDLSYATNHASTVELVFNDLSLTPIGCLTYLLPQILGKAMSNSMFYLGGTYPTVAVLDRGLLHDVFGGNSFREDVADRMKSLTVKTVAVLEATKNLAKRFEMERLHEVLDEEMRSFTESLASTETRQLMRERWTETIKLFQTI